MNVNELVTMYFQSPTLSQWTKKNHRSSRAYICHNRPNWRWCTFLKPMYFFKPAYFFQRISLSTKILIFFWWNYQKNLPKYQNTKYANQNNKYDIPVRKTQPKHQVPPILIFVVFFRKAYFVANVCTFLTYNMVAYKKLQILGMRSRGNLIKISTMNFDQLIPQ